LGVCLFVLDVQQLLPVRGVGLGTTVTGILPLLLSRKPHGGILPQAIFLVIDQRQGGADVKHPAILVPEGLNIPIAPEIWRPLFSRLRWGKDNAVISIQNGLRSQFLNRSQMAPAKAMHNFLLQQRVKPGECTHLAL